MLAVTSGVYYDTLQATIVIVYRDCRLQSTATIAYRCSEQCIYKIQAEHTQTAQAGCDKWNG